MESGCRIPFRPALVCLRGREHERTAAGASVFRSELGDSSLCHEVWARLATSPRVVAACVALVALRLICGLEHAAFKFALWLSLALLVSLAWISHAAAASAQPFGLLNDALHLYAAAAWDGWIALPRDLSKDDPGRGSDADLAALFHA